MAKKKKIEDENSGTLHIDGDLSTTTNTNIDVSTDHGTLGFNQWGLPERVAVNIYSDFIEIIFKETQTVFVGYPQSSVYKIVYSCINGKWNESDPIYGEIYEATEESYEFPSE